MLLLHEFTSMNYICPDKIFSKKSWGDDTGFTKKRGKAKYAGGLVLEPEPGLYDKIVLLLDFNSLYPSIIQEYNICFTTVERRKTQNYDGTPLRLEGMMPGEEDEVEEVQVPEVNKDTKIAILPSILKMLVEKRKTVKSLIKNEKNKEKLQQLDIRQKALKLTANSMYGCLGFSSSRFYASALAALITRMGRETLKKTIDVTQDELNYKVVYGDTDSIMVATGSNQLKDAIDIGEQVKKRVNTMY